MRTHPSRCKQTRSAYPDVPAGTFGTCKQVLPMIICPSNQSTFIHLSVSWPLGELPPIRLQHFGCWRPRGYQLLLSAILPGKNYLYHYNLETRWISDADCSSANMESVYLWYTVLLIKFWPSLPVTAQRGSAPSAHYPPERATSGIATCSVVGDTYRPVAKLSPALGWWPLPCLACLWARIRARPAKQSTGWRNTVTNV